MFLDIIQKKEKDELVVVVVPDKGDSFDANSGIELAY
jgi:hypothetical protein